MDELSNKELEYEKLKKTVAENNPMLVSLKDQINKIKPSISENLATQRKSLEASKNKLLATNERYNSMLSTLPKKERDILEMSRDQNVKSGIYSFLLQKREESELSYASTLSDSRVINTAQSSKFPVSPNKPLLMLSALIAAMAVGFVIITAKESFSSTVLYRKELESMTSIPVLGELSFNDTDEAKLIQPKKRSLLAEEFRKIRVSLHFLGIDKNQKKILVTSSIPEEGKSFIAANLAISNALTGKKVVLVDMDLHKPGLSKLFGKTQEEPGIADFLTGSKKMEEIVSKVKGYDNLFFVSSGELQESASELLLNGNINEFINYLESGFDMIVMDTAPSVLITDAYVLSDLCDATIYVVRHKHTPKMLIKRLDENMEINPLKNPGIIFNGVKKRGFFKNNYGYGYDYVYGKDYYSSEAKSNGMAGKLKSLKIKKVS
jgi:capsular exopolysaccharide synthesis family protein